MTAPSTELRVGLCGDCGGFPFVHPGRRGHIPKRCPSHRAAWEQARWSREPKDRRALAMRKVNLKFRYGITLEQYDEMFAAQGFACPVCGTTDPILVTGRGGWAVDHDHETGAVRGILCFSCNVGLGSFKDSPEVLLSAAAYLQGGGQRCP